MAKNIVKKQDLFDMMSSNNTSFPFLFSNICLLALDELTLFI